MIRTFALGGIALLFIASLAAAAPVSAQSTGTPIISLAHNYTINSFGYGILNDTVTFRNNGTATEQVPAVQLGLPQNITARAAGFALTPTGAYTLSRNASASTTTFTITPVSGTLAPGASSSVSLQTYLAGILNITAGSKQTIGALLLLRPSLNRPVSVLNSTITLPASGTIKPVPKGFALSSVASVPIYSNVTKNVTPAVSARTVVFNDTDQATFIPVQVFSVVRTIIPSTSGVPTIEDTVSMRNLASYSISSLPLTLLGKGVTNVTILPSATPPTINPTPVILTNGALDLTGPPFAAAVQAGDNFTFTMEYPFPTSLTSASGTSVSVMVPYTLPLQAVAQSYVAQLQLSSGISASGPASVFVANASPVNQGSIDLKYVISPGWGADKAVPAATLVFAAAFILLAVSRTETVAEEKEEEEEVETEDELSDMIKAMEEKLSTLNEFLEGIAKRPQGAVARAEFARIRNDLDAMKTRALRRLNEVRQRADSQRYLDLLNQIQEAEREEDRRAKDLLNLYDQYQTRRMKEETFRRLLPGYKRKLDAAMNHLSDLLNMAQREGKQA